MTDKLRQGDIVWVPAEVYDVDPHRVMLRFPQVEGTVYGFPHEQIAAWNARAGGESPDAKKLIDAYNMARMLRDKSAEDRALEALTDAINRGGGTPDPYMEVVKRYADKQSLTGLQSSWSQTGRTYEGKDYRVIVAEYGKDPVTELQNRPAVDAGEVGRLVNELESAVLAEHTYPEAEGEAAAARAALIEHVTGKGER